MEGTNEEKAAYAALLFDAGIRPNAAFSAACKFTSDMGRALYIANHWPIDPVVTTAIAAMKEANPEGDLPKRHQVAQEAYSIAIDETISVKERLNAYKLFCQVMGYLSGEDTGMRDKLPYPTPQYKIVNQ